MFPEILASCGFKYDETKQNNCIKRVFSGLPFICNEGYVIILCFLINKQLRFLEDIHAMLILFVTWVKLNVSKSLMLKNICIYFYREESFKVNIRMQLIINLIFLSLNNSYMLKAYYDSDLTLFV